jgi:hypothetical protein
MIVPPQGFRHAVALLIDKSARAIAADASAEDTSEALVRLAHDLVALAHDMRAVPEYEDWLRSEYVRTAARLPQRFDRMSVAAKGAAILTGCTMRTAIESRDLFLVYLPEDRLPIAAPLAVELAKRRVSVAFSDYEIATKEQLIAAVEHGLAHHRAGAILWSTAFERARWNVSIPDSDRLYIVRQPDLAAAATLTEFARRQSVRNPAK